MSLKRLEYHSLSISLGIIGLILNIVQITLICRQKKKKSAFVLTILSLSFADGLSALAVLIYEIYWFLAVHRIILPSMLFLWVFLGTVIFSQTASFSHLIFIALERFVAVFYPMRLAGVFSRKHCISGLVIIWVSSAAPAVTFQFTHTGNFNKLIVQVCALSLIIVYAAICIKISMRPKFVTPSVGSSSRPATNKRLIIHSISVSLAFIIFAFPYSLTDMRKETEHRVPVLLLISNSSIDPLLYFLLQYCARRRRENITGSSSLSEKNRFSLNWRQNPMTGESSKSSKAIDLCLTTKKENLQAKEDTSDPA